MTSLVDISRIVSPSANGFGQYLVEECWADRGSKWVGSCQNKGRPDLDGLCPDHYEEIFGK